MSLTNVWLQTLGDGLVRADQVVGIELHRTPALTGKTAYWLFDVVLPASIGSGVRGEWNLTVLHRTLAQTSQQPSDATMALARLLARLDAEDAAGIVTTSRARDTGDPGENHPAAAIRFRFAPFRPAADGGSAGGLADG